MKTTARYLLVMLLLAALLGSLAACGSSPAVWQRPELEYFKAVNRAGPPQNLEILLLLMAQYANARMCTLKVSNVFRHA
jgi:hypothetical protein